MVKSLLNVGAVLPAAGVGDRFGEKKQLKHLANKPLFIYALDVFVKCKEIAEIVVVANQNDIEYILKEVEPFKHKKPIKLSKKIKNSELCNIINIWQEREGSNP